MCDDSKNKPSVNPCPFKRRPHKMVKYTQLIGNNRLGVFDHFVRLAFEGLKVVFFFIKLVIYKCIWRARLEDVGLTLNRKKTEHLPPTEEQKNTKLKECNSSKYAELP